MMIDTLQQTQSELFFWLVPSSFNRQSHQPQCKPLFWLITNSDARLIFSTTKTSTFQGRIQGGRTRRAPPPLKLEKIWFFFGVKSWFFTRNTPKIFAPPSARRNFFNCDPLKLKSWIRPCISGSPGAVVIHNLSNCNNNHSSGWYQTAVIDNLSNHNTKHSSGWPKE